MFDARSAGLLFWVIKKKVYSKLSHNTWMKYKIWHCSSWNTECSHATWWTHETKCFTVTWMHNMSCYSMRGRDSEGKNSSILHFQSWIKTHLVLQWVFTAAAQQSRKIQNITADVNFYPEAQLWEVHQLKLIKVWTTVRRLLAEQIQ